MEYKHFLCNTYGLFSEHLVLLVHLVWKCKSDKCFTGSVYKPEIPDRIGIQPEIRIQLFQIPPKNSYF